MFDVPAQLGPEVFNISVPLLLIVLGAGLVVLEAFAPGAHFMVIGIAVLAAGLVGYGLAALGVPTAALLIVMAAVVMVAGGGALYGYREFDFYGGSGTGQTSDSSSLRGQTGRVTERVTERDGEVKLDDGGFNPYYRARAFDGEISEGEEIMVVDPGGGNVITVESTSVFEDDIDRELAADREGDEPDTERDGEPA
jgi:membrane protein implicated in regulation of membrane protease activity